MQRTGVSTKHWIYDLIGAGLAIAVGLGALAVHPLGLWLEEWSYDLPFVLRLNRSITGLLAVSMDEPSRVALAQPGEKGWDRQLHARLLDRLLARGARAVVFMTVFSESSPTNSTDHLFAQALRRARGKVVLAATRATGTNAGTVLSPIPELAAAAPWGMLAVRSGTDHVIRRHGTPEGAPTLGARVAQLLGQPVTNVLASLWLNYYARQIALPEVSYEQVLLGKESPAILKGKIVFVGLPPANSELLPTPYTRWTGRRAPRLEIEATAVLNLLRRESLSRPPPAVETGVLIATGGFLGLVFMGKRRSAAALLAFGAVMLIAVGAGVLVVYFQHWFPWLVVAGVQVPVALGWAWLCETVDRARDRTAQADPLQPGVALTPASSPALPATGQRSVQPSATSELPRIPDHTLVKCVGRGAYGEVWLVRDIIGRHHAVKIVKARNFPQAAPYEREFKGIEHFAPISRNHPGLMQILHVGRHDGAGYFFYIMELADDAGGGATLEPDRYSPKTLASELTRRGHFSVRDSVEIGLTLSSALHHLHNHGLVHRDIKPSNIIFVDGRAKIADIGLVAQLGSGANEMTRLGTEGYLPPEGPGAPTADLYGLGKVLYELSMGRDRWQFPEFPTTLGTRLDQDALRQLHGIILTACETEAAQRYQSAAAMHEALAKLLE